MLQTIRNFVIDNYLFGEEGKLGNEDSFMETGIIDSTGILELVRFLESTYGIKVADEELIPDNLDSVHKIVAFINAKQSATTQADGGTSLQSAGRQLK
jgi:acyl carrier protein